MKISARPWSEVILHYQKLLPACEPMLGLVQRIGASSYASGLVAYTSVGTLVVAQSEAGFWHGPELRIDYDVSAKQFVFVYRQRLDDTDPWTRTAPADEGFEVLERFLVKRARWFRKAVGAREVSSSPSSG